MGKLFHDFIGMCFLFNEGECARRRRGAAEDAASAAGQVVQD
jgi:hypothetical protein